jgi:hypothetical protein
MKKGTTNGKIDDSSACCEEAGEIVEGHLPCMPKQTKKNVDDLPAFG